MTAGMSLPHLLRISLLLYSVISVSGCSGATDETPPAEETRTMTIELTSTAFSEGQTIPSRYTCDGQDDSPQLQWRGAPKETKSYALIVDDPDAPVGTWVHWVIWNIPANATELTESMPTTETALGGARQGRNDSKRLGYEGPCPPPGKPHRYFFKLYALDAELDLKPGATKVQLLRAMEGHILAKGQLIGTYQKTR